MISPSFWSYLLDGTKRCIQVPELHSAQQVTAPEPAAGFLLLSRWHSLQHILFVLYIQTDTSFNCFVLAWIACSLCTTSKWKMEVKSQILNINISPPVHDLTELQIGRYEFTKYIPILVLFALQRIGKIKINFYSPSAQEAWNWIQMEYHFCWFLSTLLVAVS